MAVQIKLIVVVVIGGEEDGQGNGSKIKCMMGGGQTDARASTIMDYR